MSSAFFPERLIEIRKRLDINKTEAASLLNLSKMGYCRYEYGDRTPSYQTISFMADKLGTSTAYLMGETDDPSPDNITVSRDTDPELFELVVSLSKNDTSMVKRLSEYYAKIQS